MNSNKYSYNKITDSSRHTAKQLIEDLIVRSNHYARESRNMARDNILISKRLTITSLIISFTVSLLLSLCQAKFVPDSIVVWFSILGSFVISIISIIQTISFDSKVSAKNFQISQMFYEIKEDAKFILAENNYRSCNEPVLLEKYRELFNKYKNIREKYIEYMSAKNPYYYGMIACGPGKIRQLNKIKMDAIDKDEDDIFE